MENSTTYELSAEEKSFFLTLNQNAMQAKLAICDLNMKLEIAHKDLTRAETQFGTAVAFLATSKGLNPPATIAPDFSRIEGAKG